MAENFEETAPDSQVMTVQNNFEESLDGNPKLGSFVNKNGLLLKTYAWLVKYPIGIMILVHALNSHVRFEYLNHNVDIQSNDKVVLKDADNFYIYKDSWVEHLNKQGFSVYGLDMQGHGESECYQNVKTHINEFDDFTEDILQYMNIIHNSLSQEEDEHTGSIGSETTSGLSSNGGYLPSDQGSTGIDEAGDLSGIGSEGTTSVQGSTNGSDLPNGCSNISCSVKGSKKKVPPFFLMGLSMGGNVVLRTLEQIGKSEEDSDNRKLNIRGGITLGGMISIDSLKEKPIFKYFYLPISKVANYVFPTQRFGPALNFEMFPYVNDLYAFDKHCYPKPATNKLCNELLKAVDNLHNDMNYIPKNIPLLIVHSVLDSACCYKGVKNFFKKLETENKEMFTLEDMDHVLPLEPGNERVLMKVSDWITQRVDAIRCADCDDCSDSNDDNGSAACSGDASSIDDNGSTACSGDASSIDDNGSTACSGDVRSRSDNDNVSSSCAEDEVSSCGN
ncbi:lysophospholipase, putative [Plasmodium malariae]|uniref:Lysophospholipase, putative n=1 Tax=Plasmodium malariae TaxID=5858 RepID=A0A1A8WV71_PLAMA|nr:lysophospholipase, putative [Plasmodium malariae]SBS96827.1 lysophospholipase, putative [Plasmodium malariae]SBT86920.1 lysophospholipase, putative [Plasmodium malariae]